MRFITNITATTDTFSGRVNRNDAAVQGEILAFLPGSEHCPRPSSHHALYLAGIKPHRLPTAARGLMRRCERLERCWQLGLSGCQSSTRQRMSCGSAS